jgi:CTP synthase
MWVHSISRVKMADTVTVQAVKLSLAVQGRLNATRHARENKVPFLAIGVGLHIAVIESARAANMEGANSVEFDANCSRPVVRAIGMVGVKDSEDDPLRPEERVGSCTTVASPSLLTRLYGTTTIKERHCHSHIVDTENTEELTASGLRIVGQTDGGEISAVVREDHPFFLCTQFHPEFKSHPGRPSPPFVGLLLAAAQKFDEACPASDTVGWSPEFAKVMETML